MTTKNFFGRKIFCPPKWPKMVKIWPFLAKIAIFECFWPISSQRRYEFTFLVPRSAVGTYGLASVRPFVRPSVRPCVRQRSQNPFIGIFWFLAQSWAFLMRRKWRFRILPEKSRLAVFGPFWSKNGHFWPKINVSANFSKSVHRIFLILHI